jgi:drug/metabolite transporter (DMT)-like permease
VVLGVQLVGGMIVLKEKISPLAWVGTGLILSGIVLFSI